MNGMDSVVVIWASIGWYFGFALNEIVAIGMD
jgi:hypothetical protein